MSKKTEEKQVEVPLEVQVQFLNGKVQDQAFIIQTLAKLNAKLEEELSQLKTEPTP